MHELALCQALLTEVERLSEPHRDATLRRIVVRVGPLSGVEGRLLQAAFGFARAGSVASEAELAIESTGVRVRCRDCAAESDVPPNRLLCSRCGGYHTQLVSGDEMVLARLEFAPAAAIAAAVAS